MTNMADLDIFESAAEGLLSRLLVDDPPPFALVHRPGRGDGVEILIGEMTECDRLADLTFLGQGGERELLALIPFRQIGERGFACRDDGERIAAMTVTEHMIMNWDDVVAALPRVPIALTGAGFDLGDDVYAGIVDRVVREEIGRGAGSNFVVKRTYRGTIADYSVRSALSLFRDLLVGEHGAYWTFVVHTGHRTLVGATPERHVSLVDEVATMNPISGTYRYPRSGPSQAGLLEFLGDRKETDELYMVVDEELKMMARICESGGRVIGPRLKEMARLAHTEYFIEGRSPLGVTEILRETMFAPTVTGSPLENACRVIARHEPTGRGFYSGVLALIGRESGGRPIMDSGIVLRTADIDRRGRLRMDVGATLVRDSVPELEVKETWSKAASLLTALGVTPASSTDPAPGLASGDPLGEDPVVRAALEARNGTLSRFWLEPRDRTEPALTGRRALVIDAEDAFTAMLAHQLTALGLEVVIRPCQEPVDETEFDLVVLGPGPGDPRSHQDPRIVALRELCGRLLAGDVPFLAECLGHQVLMALLGLELTDREPPSQGTQLEIDFFGRPERVGFYNTFSAWCDKADLPLSSSRGPLEMCCDPTTGKVSAVRGRGFASVQFHIESLLTEHGENILGDLLMWTLNLHPVQ